MSTVTLQTIETVGTSSSSSGVVYGVKFNVTASANISPALFVVRAADDMPMYVATVRDLLVYPDNKVAAVANQLPFYRVNSYQVAYTTLREAVEASEQVNAAVALTNRLWSQQNPGQTFGGISTETYDSSKP